MERRGGRALLWKRRPKRCDAARIHGGRGAAKDHAARHDRRNRGLGGGERSARRGRTRHGLPAAHGRNWQRAGGAPSARSETASAETASAEEEIASLAGTTLPRATWRAACWRA